MVNWKNTIIKKFGGLLIMHILYWFITCLTIMLKFKQKSMFASIRM